MEYAVTQDICQLNQMAKFHALMLTDSAPSDILCSVRTDLPLQAVVQTDGWRRLMFGLLIDWLKNDWLFFPGGQWLPVLRVAGCPCQPDLMADNLTLRRATVAWPPAGGTAGPLAGTPRARGRPFR